MIQYAGLTRGAKPLTGFNCIFINETKEFLNLEAVFYHPALVGMQEQYKDLSAAITNLTGQELPAFEVLPFLEQAPFRLRASSLVKVITLEDSVVLDKNELKALVDFMELTKEDLFTFITVKEVDSRDFLLSKKDKSILFAVEKGQQKLAKLILEHTGDAYVQLPAKIYNPTYRNKGILSGKKLYETLSKLRDVAPALLSALIVESGSAEMQQQVFSKLDEIILKEGVTYDKSSFEHQTLQIFRSKDADYKRVRNKIQIEALDGTRYALDEIAFQTEVHFSIERVGKFTLDLTNLLERYKKTHQLLNQVAEQFVDYEAPTLLKKRCFDGEAKSIRSIYDELRHANKPVENASQLAFLILLAAQEQNSKLIKQFEVYTATNTQVTLGSFDAFYTGYSTLIKKEAVLSKAHYEGLEKLLELEERASFEFGTQRLLKKPYLEKGVFYCPEVAEPTEEETNSFQLEMMEFIYQEWALNSTALATSFNEEEETVFAGLNMSKFTTCTAYALAKECLPEHLLEWIGEKDGFTFEENRPEVTIETLTKGKIEFLAAIGVQTSTSELIATRHYLATGNGVLSQKKLNEQYNIIPIFLQNTIEWLAKEAVPFTSADDRIFWLRKLYNTIDEHFETHFLPVVVGVEEDTENVTFDYLLESIEEVDCYSFDAKQQQQLKDKYALGIADVFKAITAEEKRITNIDLKGFELPTTKVECLLDIENLSTKSQEWGAPHYLKWQEDTAYSIHLFDGEMPYLIRFLDTNVHTFTKGAAVQNDTCIYVNKSVGNIEDVLFDITKYNGFTEQLLLNLLRLKNETATPATAHPIVERVIETVYVENKLNADQEAIQAPSVEEVKTQKAKQSSAKLKVSFDVASLPEDVLELLMQHATTSTMIVEKKKENSAANE